MGYRSGYMRSCTPIALNLLSTRKDFNIFDREIVILWWTNRREVLGAVIPSEIFGI